MCGQFMRKVVRVVAGAGVVLAAAWASACGPARRGVEGVGVPAVEPPTRRGDVGGPSDGARVYQSMGLLAGAGPVPFVGSVRYLAGPSPDSTLALVTLSFANRSLTFVREGDQYRASYEVQLEVLQGPERALRAEAQEVVRVQSFRETSRGDESVIFQQMLTVPTGECSLTLAVRDGGSARTATHQTPLRVPKLGAGTLSSPIPVYEATPRTSLDSLPRLVASPRSTATFGQDSLLPVYVEGYGQPASTAEGAALPLAVLVRGEAGAPLWADTATLSARGRAAAEGLYSGVVQVPVSQLGVGVTTFLAWRADTISAGGTRTAGAADTVRAPLLVSLGDELPVASFEEMLSYLRHFTTPEQVEALRAATPQGRARAWAAFLRETDPVPGTTAHEALREYFARIQLANQRFREEGTAGWLTDRGRVLVTLGDPDQIYEQPGIDVNQRGRAQIWEYRQHRVQLAFVDQTGFGRWRLTTGSEAEFQSLARRVRAG